jgi:hypothetical protein
MIICDNCNNIASYFFSNWGVRAFCQDCSKKYVAFINGHFKWDLDSDESLLKIIMISEEEYIIGRIHES